MIRILGNIGVRSSGIRHETGFVHDGDIHNFHHVTYFPLGEWEAWRRRRICNNDGSYKLDENGQQLWVEVDRVKKKAGGYLLIEADCQHGFRLLNGPGEFHCIYSLRDPDTHEVVEEYNGWEDALG